MPLHTPSCVTSLAALKIGTSGAANAPPKYIIRPPPYLTARPCTAGFDK